MSNSFPFAVTTTTHPLKPLFANGKSKASRKLRIQTQSSRDMRDSNKIALEKSEYVRDCNGINLFLWNSNDLGGFMAPLLPFQFNIIVHNQNCQFCIWKIALICRLKFGFWWMFHSNGFLNLQKGLLIALTIPTPPILKIQEEENEESFVYHKVAFPPPHEHRCVSVLPSLSKVGICLQFWRFWSPKGAVILVCFNKPAKKSSQGSDFTTLKQSFFRGFFTVFACSPDKSAKARKKPLKGFLESLVLTCVVGGFAGGMRS